MAGINQAPGACQCGGTVHINCFGCNTNIPQTLHISDSSTGGSGTMSYNAATYTWTYIDNHPFTVAGCGSGTVSIYYVLTTTSTGFPCTWNVYWHVRRPPCCPDDSGSYVDFLLQLSTVATCSPFSVTFKMQVDGANDCNPGIYPFGTFIYVTLSA